MTTWRDKYTAGFLNNVDETTREALLHIIHTTKKISPLPDFERLSADVQISLSFGMDCDQVYPNIYIGDVGAAKNKHYLRRIGITHVLNTAEGKGFGMVNTSKDYYRDTNIKYMGIQLLDLPVANISMHFEETAAFIENGVKRGGKVLVHCVMGMSRSSTCVLSYLMIKVGLTATEALRTVRLHRSIRPNDGFLHQLAKLDNKLRRERGRMANL
ncbi:dual specificity protein phosphatase 3 isoform X2 [Zootermopsis nevadensis]|uniref:Dual specificity protein phosphatase n=1 Tax=Zootermopsis nevadensis TaxID=136037 RepID=A0A067RCC9_ZOONE|nr:dual specificity protein phosphatase 3 isoform X2 [Zootermopsis nevadensis]KDR16390.1 Dual specificity phosphatase DUPD1 [Zootermopsis nevadensis]